MTYDPVYKNDTPEYLLVIDYAQYTWLASNRPNDIPHSGYSGSAQAIKNNGIAAAYISPEGHKTYPYQRPVLYLHYLYPNVRLY